MNRGEEEIQAAIALADTCSFREARSVWDLAFELELSIYRSDREAVRDTLGVLIRKAMIVGDVRRTGAAGNLAREAARRNEEKGHWSNASLGDLIEKLYEEIDELYHEVALLRRTTRRRIREELGDVIWTAVMVVDRCGYLAEEDIAV